MILAKHTTSNSHNENTLVSWGLFSTPQQFELWAGEHAEKIKQWNTNTPGAVSVRCGDVQSWEDGEFEHIGVDNLDGMRLGMFKKVLEQIPTV